MQSYLTTALHLTGGESKEGNREKSVLQALFIQRELHKKIKLFGNNIYIYLILFYLNVVSHVLCITHMDEPVSHPQVRYY